MNGNYVAMNQPRNISYAHGAAQTGGIARSIESPWLPTSAVLNPYSFHLKTLYLNAQFTFKVSLVF